MSLYKAKWYLLYTKSKMERKIGESLKELGIDYLLPTKTEVRILSDRKKTIQTPLFPGYLFVFAAEASNIIDTLSIANVLYFVRCGREKVIVPDTVIDNIRIVTSKNLPLDVCRGYIAPGSKVFIKSGPLTGLRGEIVEYQNEKQILIRVDFLGRYLIVKYAKGDLIT